MGETGGGLAHRSVRAETGPVAQTKFNVPRIPSATVRRDTLIARLEAAVDCPLSLVVAAPGSGKSALLAQWVEESEGAVAWMTCDTTDRDPVGFWRNLALVVGMAWTDAGMAAAEFADTDRSERLAVGLANELGSLPQPGVIVIDDFHLAAPEPVVMQAFISALPPHVRLALGSRHDPSFPLGRLRVQGRLLELRQADLRFSRAEASRLLADLGLDLDDRTVEQIASVTEGWTAGLYLAGLWLQGHGDTAGLLGSLAETDRGLIDFLISEVIELQPPEIVEFLMVTAEIEVFDAALCDAVRNESNSLALLRQVRAANLFLTELDRGGGWYRYHHLFAQFLRGRLHAVAGERIPAIHRAAAAAYQVRGNLIDAVRHSMKAGDTDKALAQLESYGTTMWSLEAQATGVATVRAWLEEQGAGELQRSPSAVLACTIVLNAAGHSDYAEHWLRAVDARQPELDAEDRLLLHGAWSFDLLQRGDPVGAMARVQSARAILQDHRVSTPWVHGLPNVAIAGLVWLGDLDGAEATAEAVRLDPARPPVVSQVRMPAFASHIAALRGELTEAERLATAALEAADQLGLPDGNFGRAEPHLGLAMVAIERNHLDGAEEHLERLMRIVEGDRRPPLELLAHLELAQLAHARGDERTATEAVEQARALLPHATKVVTARIDQVDVQLALDRGDRETAEAVQRRLPPSPSADLLAARVHLAAGDPMGALGILESMDVREVSRRLAIEHSLLSCLNLAAADSPRALQLLQRAVVLGQPVGFERIFIAAGPTVWRLLESLDVHGPIADYAAKILRASRAGLPAPPNPTWNALAEPLSDREIIVLRYLASRLTSTEIARELYLSVNTVRFHVKAIYRKLGVNSRDEAVRRGHRLGVT